MIAAILIVIIVVAAVGGAIILMSPKGPSPTASPSGTSNPTNNPSYTGIPTISTSPGSTGQPQSNLAGASSLKYSVAITGSDIGLEGTYTFWGKNAGTDNFMVRVEVTTPESPDKMIVIVNGAQKKAWTYVGSWIDVSEDFEDEWDSYNDQWQGYLDDLSAWSGTGDYTYTYSGTTVRIFDISINPNLPDSLFQP